MNISSFLNRTFFSVCLVIGALSQAHANVNTINAYDNPEPTLEAGNPIPLFFEGSKFYQNDYYLNESFWRNQRIKFFGKEVFNWNKQDFSYLEYRLKQQIKLELEEATQFNIEHKNTSPPEQDSMYLLRKKWLEKAIATIPRMIYWTEQSRLEINQEESEKSAIKMQHEAEVRESEAQAEQARLAQKKYELQQKAEETSRAVEYEKQRVLEEKAQAIKTEEDLREGRLFLISLVVIALIAAFIWHKFLRKRCPRCNSLNHDIEHEEEVERWRGMHEVRERNTRGTTSRSVNTLMHRVKYDNHCDDCGHDWSHTVRKPV